MVLLDVSVLNVALPSIAEDFNAKMSDVQWILNAYTVTMVLLLILAGKVGDMVRRDLYYMAGMALFGFSSYLCAEAWDVTSLIAFRALQAVGGAMLSSNVLAIMVELFPPGKRGAAMGLNSILTASAFTLGPILGGWLTTHLSWHWVFYINLPVSIISLVLAWVFLPKMEAKVRESIDLLGLILLSIGIGALTVGIIKGEDWGWSSQKTLACFIVAIPYLIAFVLRELICEYPLLDPDLFRIRNFSTGVVSLSLLFLCIATSLFLLPFFLQGIKGLSAEESGYWLVAIPLTNVIVSPIAGRLSDRTNPKYLMSLGPVLFIFGLYLVSDIGADITFWELSLKIIPLGVGIGMLMAPTFNVVMASVPPHKAGMANGAVRTINTLAQAMGIAIGGVLLTGKMSEYIPGYGNQLPDPGTMSLLKLLAEHGNPLPLMEMTEAFIKSMHYVFLTVIWLPLLSLLVILVFLSGEEHLEKMKVGLSKPEAKSLKQKLSG
jgi:EmrB/QacA subfamily drug resistance transporter